MPYVVTHLCDLRPIQCILALCNLGIQLNCNQNDRSQQHKIWFWLFLLDHMLSNKLTNHPMPSIVDLIEKY